MRKRNFCLILMLFLLVGCRSQNLSCTKVIMKNDEASVDERISLTFKKKKLTEGIYSLNYTFANNVDANVEAARKALEEQYSVYKDSKGVDYSFSNMDQGIHFQLQLNNKKLTDEEKEDFDIFMGYDTYQKAKNKLIEEGYQCK